MRYRFVDCLLGAVWRIVAGILLTGVVPAAAAADWKPSRNVELVVGSSALFVCGGTSVTGTGGA